MVRYIATGTVNWADEMDIPYSHVYTAKELKDAISYTNFVYDILASEYSDCDKFVVYTGIGTNEEIDLCISDVFSFLKMTKITDSEYKTLQRFGFTDMGPDLYSSFIEDDGLSDLIKNFNGKKVAILKQKKCQKLSTAEKEIIKKETKLQNFKNFLNED